MSAGVGWNCSSSYHHSHQPAPEPDSPWWAGVLCLHPVDFLCPSKQGRVQDFGKQHKIVGPVLTFQPWCRKLGDISKAFAA